MKKRKALVGVALMALALVGLAGPGASAQSTSTDVVMAALAGTRTLVVTTVSGASLDGGTLDLGDAGSGAFGVAVADVTYDHVGYDVTATMSNLYRFDGTFECGKRIDSGDMAVDFPVDSTVDGLGAVVSGLVDLDGTVNGALASALDPLGIVQLALTPLGLSITGQDIAIPDLPVQVSDTVDGLLDGLDDLLPVKVQKGTAGNFTAPAAHGTCAEGAGTPTQIGIMAGDASSTGDLFTSIVADLQSQVDALTGSALISGGVIDSALAEAGAAAAIAGLQDTLETLAGIPLPPLGTSGGAVQAVLDLVTGTLDATNLLGQTGAYLTIPTLNGDTGNAPQTGSYRGTMTVTLVDTP